MKRLASLVSRAAFALPCAASGPVVSGFTKPPKHYAADAAATCWPPASKPPLLNDQTVRVILAPGREVSRWALAQIGIERWRQTTGSVMGLQVPGVSTPNLDISVRAGFGWGR